LRAISIISDIALNGLRINSLTCYDATELFNFSIGSGIAFKLSSAIIEIQDAELPLLLIPTNLFNLKMKISWLVMTVQAHENGKFESN
jgi:hypothetical protein